jgi:thiol-disulfide isomerase/thioredoxin
MPVNAPEPLEKATTPQAPPSLAQRFRNFLIVSIGMVLATLVVLGVRTQTPAASLETLAVASTPLETALVNGKPSLVEFYANWCTSCQAMAGDMAALNTVYGNQVNFVMLNVDNTKWLPEMLHYRVDGIPHFVYLDEDGSTIAMAIGEQPKTVIAENLDALILGEALPYQQATGRTSDLEAPGLPTRSDDPRSHGAQASS